MSNLPDSCAGTDEYRDAVLRRNARADGLFVYAVRTTGIYCRPSCPSRAARPENICFFADADAAEQAGFRACLRCRPREAGVLNDALIADICRYIEGAESAPRPRDLALHFQLSPFHLQRLFKAGTGISPAAYARQLRAERLRQSLDAAGNVTEALYAGGYASSGRLHEEAVQMLGMKPGHWRAGGKGQTVVFAIGQCRLGALLLAESALGLCCILLGDEPEPLLQRLQQRFHAATLIGADPAFEARMARVAAFVEQPATGLDLPLDVRGTLFQQRVWQALRAIPAGSTVSYSELALRIGAPGSARAVAGACAANTLAVAIPCHRVVRADGSLSGYRWGGERKRQLLDAEAAQLHARAGDDGDLDPRRT